MKLAVLTSLYPTCAREREGIFAERRWLAMRGRGHDVRVVHPLPFAPWPLSLAARWRDFARIAAVETRGGIEVRHPRYLHLPKSRMANARAFARVGVATILRGGRPDAVVCDYAWPAAAASPSLRRERIPCVVSGRGSDVLQVAGEAGLGAQLARYLETAGHWCAVSQDLVRRMDELAGAPGRGVLVANGVDRELFHPRERGALRAKLGLDGAARIVLVVGHWIERKDPLLALAAFDAWVKSTNPNARAIFVGRGPLEAALRDAVRRRGLEARVELAGEKSPAELAEWYAAADVLLLTSSREGRPNVVLEALSSGLPVVATRAGGTEELLHGLPNALGTSRDPDELGRLLARTLAAPPPAETLVARVESLDWNRGLEALEGCLARAIAETGEVPR